jgi:uncharacterized protein YdaU (DUF1376 family)
MSLEAEGAYIRLLAYNWQDGSIPADIDQLARMCKTTPRKMATLWQDHLKDCFVLVDSEPGKYVNIRLEEVREEQQEYRANQSVNGKLGAKARWRDRQKHSGANGTANAVANGGAIATGMANDSSSSPSSVIPPISPPLGDRFVYPADFETFWQAYPEKSGKRGAYGVWKQLKPSAELLSKMLKTLDWQRASEDWTKENGKYIPDPERWLKRGKWDDEPTAELKKQRKVPSIFEAL